MFAFVNQAVLTYSILGAAALRIPDPTQSSWPLWVTNAPPDSGLQTPDLYLDKDCSGNQSCVDVTSNIRQSLSTSLLEFSARELESFDNEGFVVKRNVFTNQKLLADLGKDDISLMKKMPMNAQLHAMNHIPAIRALLQAEATQSLLRSLTGGSNPVGYRPYVFGLKGGARECDQQCIKSLQESHQDGVGSNSTTKVPTEINVWIPLTPAKEPLAMVRGSHYQWGPLRPKCKKNAPFGIHYNLSCVIEHFGEQSVAAPDFEIGDVLFMNGAVVHQGLHQARERLALSLRYRDAYSDSPRYRASDL